MLAAVSWTGGATGNWDAAANWSNNAVPTSTADVTIDTVSAATITIKSGDAESVHSLIVGSNDALSLTGGSLSIAAGLTNRGTITVGSSSSITSGTLAQNSTGTLDLQLGGAPSSGSFGLVNITGAATLGGTLRADLVNGYAPTTTDTFTPIEFASASGTFANESLPSGSTYKFNAAVTFTNVVVSAAPTATVTTTIDAGNALHAATQNLLGVNLAYWDNQLTTSQTQQVATAAGLDMYRFPGGSSSDDFHFNVANNWGDSAANTIPQFAQFISTVGGTGLVTTDYGSGSPQEAAAELAYLQGSATDTTVIGSGIEWNDNTNQWQTVNWQTVGYWASLRTASPLTTNDGLNFLRINHAAPFSNIKDWEIGNEEYGGWEIDHHGTLAPGNVSTGAQHDPATYAAFASQFAALATEITNSAGLPAISIGIDSGDPTGFGDGNWTKNVLTDGVQIGFVPGFISDHSYMQAPGAENDSTLLNATDSDPASVLDWSTRYADYQSLLQQTLSSKASSVTVMATEFNSVYTDPGKQSTSLVNGLFIANSIGSLLDSGYTGAFVWDLRNGWSTGGNNSNLLYGWRQGGDYGLLGDPSNNNAPSTGAYIAYPNYYAMQLASKLIATGGQVVSAASNYGDLDVYAVKQSNGHLELLVINTNPAATLNDQFNFTGFQPSGSAQVWQYGETQDTAQSQTANGSSALASSSASLNLSGANFSYAFPAYSMTVLDLSPAGTTPPPSVLTITGTSNSNDDVSITLLSSTQFNVTANGATTTYSTANYNQVVYNAPTDGTFSKVVFADSSGVVVANESLGSTTASDGSFQFQANGATNLYVYGGPGSTATVNVGNGGASSSNFFVVDTAHDYSYIGDPATGVYSELSGFGAETVNGSAGTTYAYLYSSSHASTVVSPAQTNFTLSGVTSTLSAFAQVYVVGAADGSDLVTLDSSGGTLVATPGFSYVEGTSSGNSFLLGALYCANVIAQASSGGSDAAIFYSYPQDAFQGALGVSSLAGSTSGAAGTSYSFQVQALGYLAVSAFESGAGTDTASLTSPGNGHFVSTSTVSTLSVGTSTITVNTYFQNSGQAMVAVPSAVSATGSSNGSDTADLYDAAGSNSLAAQGNTATLTTQIGKAAVTSFSKVNAYQQNGSDDTVSEQAVDFALQTIGIWTSAG